jgi:hypothetical protein
MFVEQQGRFCEDLKDGQVIFDAKVHVVCRVAGFHSHLAINQVANRGMQSCSTC